MKESTYYTLAVLLSFGGFEMVFTLPVNIAYAVAFLHLQKKNLEATGRGHTLAGFVVFLVTIVLGRLSIPLASDSGSPDYLLPGIMGVNGGTAYSDVLPHFAYLLLLYNIVFFVISRKSTSTALSFSYAVLVGAVFVMVHVLPLSQALETVAGTAKFIEEIPTVSATQVEAPPVPLQPFEPQFPYKYSDRIHSDENSNGRIRYFDKEGGELIQYQIYADDYARQDVLHIDSAGNIVRIDIPRGKGYSIEEGGAVEVGSNLYISVRRYGALPTYETYEVIGIIK